MSLQTVLIILLGIIMVITAVLALESKKIITGVIYLSLLSLLAVVGFLVMSAPDVAITEAVIGSGLVTALFVFTLMGVNEMTTRKKESISDLDVHPSHKLAINDLKDETIIKGGDIK